MLCWSQNPIFRMCKFDTYVKICGHIYIYIYMDTCMYIYVCVVHISMYNLSSTFSIYPMIAHLIYPRWLFHLQECSCCCARIRKFARLGLFNPSMKECKKSDDDDDDNKERNPFGQLALWQKSFQGEKRQFWHNRASKP